MSKVAERPALDRSFEQIMAATEPGGLLKSFTANRPTVAERMAAGKALRTKVSRRAHGVFHPGLDKARRTGRIHVASDEVVK